MTLLMNKIDALYIRVSTEQQVVRGESIETQKSRLLQYAKDKDLNPKIYEDPGYSACDTNRPAFRRLIADIKAGKVASVTITKLDRMSRNLQDAIDLIYNIFEEQNVSLHALDQQLDTASPTGRLMINLLATVAQWEREMTSERVSIDMRHRAQKGKWCGGPVPYGYASYSSLVRQFQENGLSKEDAFKKASAICQEEGMLYPHPENAVTVKKMFDRYLETKSQRAVTHWLNNEGYKTPRGTTWASSSVSRILRNPVYVGKMIWGKRVSSKTKKKLKKRPEEEWLKVDGIHASIIDEGTFKRTQAILKSQAREPIRHASESFLSGLLRCGKCGGKMHNYEYVRDDHSWAYYRCTNHTHKGNTVCEGNSVDRNKIEKAVIDKLHEAHKGQELVEIQRAADVFNKKVKRQDGPLKEEKEQLKKENEKALQSKRVLIAKLSNETIGDGDFKLAVKELDDTFKKNTGRIQAIDDQLSDLGIQEVSFDTVYSNLNDFPRRWKHLDFQGRKALLWSLLKSVKYTDPDTDVDVEIFLFKKKLSANSTVTCMRTDMDSWQRLKENWPEM